MKKSLRGLGLSALFVFVALVALAFAPSAYALNGPDFATADENNPLEILSANDFIAFTEYANENATDGKYFELGADIDLSEVSYKPVGTINFQFNGHFDGKGHKVELNINTASDYAGLFGYVGNNGVIKGVTVGGSVVGRNYVGGIAGYSAGKISECVNLSSVGTATDGANVGGIVGNNVGTLSDCVNAGEIKVFRNGGGIAGRNGGDVSAVLNCVNFGKIIGVNSMCSKVGGLIGENSGFVSDSYNYAQMEVSGDRIGSAIGDLAGLIGGSGKVYNVSEGSGREVVGWRSVTAPDSFKAVSYYELLLKDDYFTGMDKPEFEEGFGFLNCPDFILQNSELKIMFKKSLFGGGDGTESAPFEITDEREWALFAENTVFSYSGKFVRLSSDLNVGEIKPLSQSEGFNGDFNGGGHKITFKTSALDAGLFLKLDSGARVGNLTAEGEVTADNRGGILAAASEGEIYSVVALGSVRGRERVGGIVGEIEGGKITDCKNGATVYGIRYVGGIAGVANLAIGSDLTNEGEIGMTTGSGFGYFGGIFGSLTASAEIKNLINTGSVSAYRADNVGGIAGEIVDADLNMLVSLGEVAGRNNVGGIVGRATANKRQSVFNVLVISTVFGATNVGGMNGSNNGYLNIDIGFFSGNLGEVGEATVNRDTFSSIAPAASVGNAVYYNSDIIYGDGISVKGAKSALEILSVDFGADWSVKRGEKSFGYFPVPDLTAITEDEAIIESKIKYEFFGGGEGTEAEPYRIDGELHLRNLGYLVNTDKETYGALNYEQTADITFERPFAGIGAEGFGGIYDGNYYALKEADFESSLFITLDGGAIIRRVAVESGRSATAGLAAAVENGALIENCYSRVNIASNGDAGGLVRENNGTISASFFAGRIDNALTAGGIAAENRGEINDCFSSAYISAGAAVGGIAGINRGRIKGCVVSGTVKGSAEAIAVGGLAGRNIGGTYLDSYITAVITTDGKTPSDADKKAGAILGITESSVNLSAGIRYNSDYAQLSAAYYDGGVGQNARGYAATSLDMQAPSFAANFTSTRFVFGLNGDKDSEYAPRNQVFADSENARVQALSAEAVKLRIYGFDHTSSQVWGGIDNPYLISTFEQLEMLSERAETYDYADSYFRMTADIDMQMQSFRQIGRFVSQSNRDNRIFNGKFDGAGYTLKNLILTEEAQYGYVALFGYTGSGFELKNLIIDENSVIESDGNAAASFVGFNGGNIEHCISRATVTGASVGGIAVASASGTRITDCVFAGKIPEEGSSFGLTSQAIDTVKIDFTNSWYLRANDGDQFIQAGREGYVHNNYGSVLFADRGGSVEVEYTESGILFRLIAENGYKGKIMTSQDGVLYEEDGDGFNPRVNANVNNGGSVKFYARFTVPVSFDVTGETAALKNEPQGGEYYRGQRVRFSFNLNYGYFIDYLDEYASFDIGFSNEAETVVLNLTVPDDTASTVPIKICAFNDYAKVVLGSGQYDGQAKEITVEAKLGYEDKFGEFFPSVFYGADLSRVAAIVNAGDYTVKIPIVLKNGDYFLGIMAATTAVTPITLSPSADDDYWSSAAVKIYDGTDYYEGIAVSASQFADIVAGDENAVVIKADVKWNGADAGTGNKTAVISNFRTEGEKAVNYVFADGTSVRTERASIRRKTVVASIGADGLEGEYTGSRPSVRVSLSTSVGSADVVLNFRKVSDENSGQWGIGRYEITVNLSDVNNYELQQAEEYIYTVKPRIIDSVDFSGYENLIYNGGNLSANVNGIYRTVNQGYARVDFTFYYGGDTENGLSEIINAGSYIGAPEIADMNYALSENVRSLQFEVSKATSSEDLNVTLMESKTQIKTGERIELSVSGYISGDDAKLKVITPESSRARLEIIKENEKYYLYSTRYENGAVTFKIAAVDSTNYEDRESVNSLTLEVAAGSIFVALTEESRTHVFGDKLDLHVVYSFGEGFEEKDLLTLTEDGLSDSEGNVIGGFYPPEFEIERGELHAGRSYEVSFYGGGSDGYVLKPAAGKCSVTVVPREITVGIPRGTYNGKVYGESDPKITFFVYDGRLAGISPDTEILTALPDGREARINGELSRESGETAGAYGIVEGTVTDENNPDYKINYVFGGVTFEISKKNLSVAVNANSKEYGEADPELTYSVIDGQGFAFDDDENSVRIILGRAEGEDPGLYDYTATYFESDNYLIRIDYLTNKFRIAPATPTLLDVRIDGSLIYGDTAGKLSVAGRAVTKNGTEIRGKFVWKDEEKILNAGQNVISYRFEPDLPYYNSVESSEVVQVAKRPLEVGFDGVFEYVYNGGAQCDIRATALNLLAGDEVRIQTEVVGGRAVNAGSYVFRATMAEHDNYTIAGGAAEAVFTIYKARINVTLESETINEGDSYVPKIKYEGFVGGDGESVLTKRATVGDLPQKGGVYSLIPSGAAADNYEFSYTGASIVINKKSVSDGVVTVGGSLGPALTLKVNSLQDKAQKSAEKAVNKALKKTIITPNSQKLTAYYELDFSDYIEGDLKYSVALDINGGDKIYLVLSDGSAIALTDFETVTEELKTAEGEDIENAKVSNKRIEFTSSQIVGIAVFTDKTIAETIVGYLPLAGIILGGVLLIVTIIAIARELKRRAKSREQYVSRYK